MASILWRRLPVYFPNIKLIMRRPSEAALKKARLLGFLKEASHAQAKFRTTPEVTKLELREFFEKVYGVAVKQVHTNIVLGRLRTKRDKQGNLTRERVKGSDYKLAWVEFDEKIPLQKPSIKPLAHVRALAESL